METITRITHTLFLLLFLSVAACQQKDTADGNGSSPNPNLPTDLDLGHGYVKRDGTIHFIGGGTTGTGANATRIDTPSWGLLTKMVASKYGAFKTAKGLDVASVEFIQDDPAGYQFLSDKNGIYLCEMKFPRSKPGKVEVIDNFTVKVGDLIHTVSAYQYTPVTVFKEQGKLMAEAPCYDPTNDKWLGMIRAEVTNGGLSNIHTVPLPGQSEAPSLPDWQRRAFERSDLVQRMIEGGRLLKK